MSAVPVSILDLASIGVGETLRESLEGCVQVAQAAERLGYTRVWYAEHHNSETIASSATSVLIAHVAAHTKSIRLGSGGVMLPNHSHLSSLNNSEHWPHCIPDALTLASVEHPELTRQPSRHYGATHVLPKHSRKTYRNFRGSLATPQESQT